MRQTTPADRPRVIQFPVKASRMVGAAGVVLAAAFLHGVPWGAVFSAAQAQGRPPTIMRATRTEALVHGSRALNERISTSWPS